MLILIPTHLGRVAPFFEASRHALLVEIEGGEETSRAEIPLRGGQRDRVSTIAATGAETFICGAISDPPLGDLLHRGVLVWPGAAGDVEEVIESFVSSGALDARFMMPGWGGQDLSLNPHHRHRFWGWWAG